MDSIDPKLSTIPTHSTTLCDVVKQGKTVLLLSRKYDIINKFYLSEELIMNYKRINEHEIEIIPEETPIDGYNPQ